MSSSKTEDRILRHTGEGDALCHHPRQRTGYCAIPKWRQDMYHPRWLPDVRSVKMATGYTSSKMATGCDVISRWLPQGQGQPQPQRVEIKHIIYYSPVNTIIKERWVQYRGSDNSVTFFIFV